ncbi:MAG: aldehyde ferredoxin oxidoreductase family protein [Armatimonadota bacterium]
MYNNDPLKNVLYIDLSKKTFEVKDRHDLFDKYIGGAGVASKLLLEECPEGADPLSHENPIIFAVGPLTGVFPLASKTIAMFKSPHTGNLGESHAGGRSAIAIRFAGYGAIVIKGKSDIPCYISVNGSKVYFRDASTLWGMESSFTSGRIIREREENPGMRTIMRIGRGGENLISYASVTTETYRHFGRLGLGAVFGSKKLKAVVIGGNLSHDFKDMGSYKVLYDKIYSDAVESNLMKKYHDLGTSENVNVLNTISALPTRNLNQAVFDKVEGITGEGLAEHYLGRRIACSGCPVGCIHIAALREPSETELYFYKTSMISYDYELIYALGSMLGISDPEGLLKLIDRVEKYGLDIMSTGVVLSWATEALKKNLITENETSGVKLEWGDYKAYMEAVNLIIEGETDFYKTLGKGVDYASSKYGGEDFAMAFGKNEMPGYHTGPAAYLGFLIGARHSHLDNAGYSIDEKTIPKVTLTPEETVDKLMKEEKWRCILSSIAICFFARGIYTPDKAMEALKITGFDITEDVMNKIGEEIYKLKFEFKFREGFSLDNIRIPKRIFETPSPLSGWDEQYMRKALSYAKKKITAV